MGVYVVPGSASGIGRAVIERLADTGHEVAGVDVQQADVMADLGTVVVSSNAATTAPIPQDVVTALMAGDLEIV